MKLNLFVPITKIDVEKREVWGRAAEEVPDKSGEIFDYATSIPLFREWSAEFEKVTDGKSLGNIRAMHGKVAAGKMIAFQPDDAAKVIDIGTKIVDDNEWTKCLEGVYTGFSIGGSYLKRWKDAANATLTRYTAAPSEISVVDNPCMAGATFSMVKADGSTEDRPFQRLALLKSALAGDLTNRELFDLASNYLPDGELDGLAKAEGTLGDLRAQLVTLAEDPAAPTPEVAPAKVFKVLGKGMYSVESFSAALCSLAWIAQDAEAEAMWEGDSSSIPAKLRAWLAAGVAIFKEMSAEEADELLASITPAGVVLEMAAKAAAAEQLAKLATDSAASIAALEKSVGTLATERDDLAKRLTDTTADLEKVSAAAAQLLEVRKGSLRVVSKEGDQAGVVDVTKDADPNAPPDSIAEMKKAFLSPTPVLPVPK